MLKIFDSLEDIDIRRLKEVYEESNANNGRISWPQLPENLQILYAEQDFYTCLASFFRCSGAKYAVWELSGRYVCAARIEPYDNGLLLSGLETLPDYRNMGHASSLVAAVIAELKRSGHGTLYSHVAKNNAASLAVHRRCGFEIASQSAVYVDGTTVSDCFTLYLKY